MNRNIGDMTESELKDFIVELQEIISRIERKINKAIGYMENYISVEEYNEPVKCEFRIIIRKLKGDNNE